MLFRRFHVVDAACDYRLRLHLLRWHGPWIVFSGCVRNGSVSLLIVRIPCIAAILGFLRALDRRLFAGGFKTCGGAKIRGQQCCGFESLLRQLHVDLALLFRTKLAPRHRFGTVRQLFGGGKRDIRAEHLVHFGADDFHHFGGSIHRLFRHALGERVFAERLVEFDPQAVAAQQHTRHFFAVHITAHIFRERGHQSIPLLVGGAIVMYRSRCGSCHRHRRRGRRSGCNGRHRAHRLLNIRKHGSHTGSDGVGGIHRRHRRLHSRFHRRGRSINCRRGILWPSTVCTSRRTAARAGHGSTQRFCSGGSPGIASKIGHTGR